MRTSLNLPKPFQQSNKSDPESTIIPLKPEIEIPLPPYLLSHIGNNPI